MIYGVLSFEILLPVNFEVKKKGKAVGKEDRKIEKSSSSLSFVRQGSLIKHLYKGSAYVKCNLFSSWTYFIIPVRLVFASFTCST